GCRSVTVVGRLVEPRTYVEPTGSEKHGEHGRELAGERHPWYRREEHGCERYGRQQYGRQQHLSPPPRPGRRAHHARHGAPAAEAQGPDLLPPAQGRVRGGPGATHGRGVPLGAQPCRLDVLRRPRPDRLDPQPRNQLPHGGRAGRPGELGARGQTADPHGFRCDLRDRPIQPAAQGEAPGTH
ncbi:hypothetical protein B484DRAFT_223922, partial [Ochromonadaceae sp. CCMP2298]